MTEIEVSDMEEIVGMVWESVLEAPVYPAGAPTVEEASQAWLHSEVHLHGESSAHIEIDCAQNLADLLAEALFDVAESEVTDDDRRDALGELANMTGGSLKGLLPGSSQLGLPEVATLANPLADTSGIVAESWFRAGEWPFAVRVTEPTPAS